MPSFTSSVFETMPLPLADQEESIVKGGRHLFGKLGKAYQAFRELFELDESLIKAAAAQSKGKPAAPEKPADAKRLVAKLTAST